MTRKFLTVTALLLSGMTLASAACPERKGSARVSFGAEWGYTVSVSNTYRMNYIHPQDGFRVDREGTDLYLSSNAFADIFTGLEFHRHYGVSLHAGLAGIRQSRQIVPVSLRETYFFNAFDSDGVMAYIEEGVGFHTNGERQSYLMKIGTGYRIALGSHESLDFGLAFRAVTDHPPVYDSDLKDYIPDEFMRRSDALYTSINISVSVSF